VRYVAAATLFGEALPEDRRKELVSHLGTGSKVESSSIYALTGDSSREHLDGLLKSLQSGNISAPMALIQFLDDPRVQPALVEAMVRACPEGLANFAQVVGLVGGPGSRERLRERMMELRGSPETVQPADFHNWLAGSLQSVAEALLRLEPDAQDAAEALVGLLTHPCKSNRESATRVICDVLAREPSAQVREHLAQSLRPFLESADDAVFLVAAPSLLRTDTNRVLARLKHILASESEVLRACAVNVLAWAPGLLASRCLSLLATRVEEEESLRLSVQIVSILNALCPRGRVKSVATRALQDASPALRMGGIALLALLDGADARDLAEAALTDEPDPLLKQRLVGIARH
jgi:hypothetical protein